MSNDFYTSDGVPATGSFGASAPMRGQFSAIEDAFDKLPTLTGNPGRAVVVNLAGTGLTVTTGTLALAGNFATTGAFSTTIIQGANVSITLPVVSGTLATLAGTETLTNKTLTAPVMTAPALGVIASGDGSALTGTAASLNVGYAATAGTATTATTATTVITNANMTGPITGTGNVTSITAQTGTGTTFVVQDTPTLTTPLLGVATATSINKVTITAPASSATLTIANGKVFTVSNTLTLTATDSSTLAIGTGGTLASAAYVATGTSGATIPLLNGTNTWSGANTFQNATTTLGVQQTTRGALVLANTAGGAFATTIQSSNSASAAWTLTLPVSAGTSGWTLQTDGAGVTSWAASSASGGGGTTVSGSVTLTSSSVGAQSITPSAFGQFVKLPDATTMSKASNNFNVRNAGGYPLKVLDNSSNILGFIYPGDSSMIGCADSSTAAGVWTLTNTEPVAVTARLTSTTLILSATLKKVVVDSDRTLLLIGSGATNLYGVMYTASTTTFGTPTLIRSSAANCFGYCYTTDKVLVTSCNATTAFEAVVLSLSGNTITVNTAATATNAANINGDGFRNIVACGSTYIAGYSIATTNIMRAMTISGTTVTIGSEASASGLNLTYFYLVGVSATVFLTISMTNNVGVYAKPFSISGTTISAGTEASVVALTSTTDIRVYTISSGARWVILYVNAANTHFAASIVSVAGSVATLSSVNLVALTSASSAVSHIVGISDASKLICYNFADGLVNILTDTGGTASAGTAITVAIGANGPCNAFYASGNVARFMRTTASVTALTVVGYSGSSPTLSDHYLYSITNGYLGQIIDSSFNGSRAPQIFIGAQTLSLSTFTGTATGMRAPIATGNVLLPRYLRMTLETSLSGSSSNAAVGQNGTWNASTTVLGGTVGLLQMIEGVT